MISAALLVDYESLLCMEGALEPGGPGTRAVLSRLLEVVQPYGVLDTKVAWADWERYPGAVSDFLQLRFELRDSDDGSGTAQPQRVASRCVKQLLHQPEAIDCFIVVSCDMTLAPLLQEIRQRSRRVVLVAEEGAVPGALADCADLVLPFSWRLPLEEGGVLPARRPLPPAQVEPAAYLVYERVRAVLSDLLKERHLPWASFRLLAGELLATHLATQDTVQSLVERTVSAGYLVREEELGAVKRFYKFLPGPGAGEDGKEAPERGLTSLFNGVSRTGVGLEAVADPSAALGREVRGRSGPWTQDWRNFTFVKMLWVTERYLQDKPSRFYFNPSSLAELLQNQGIGRSEEEAFFWINQAVDKGLLSREVRDVSSLHPQRFFRYYLNLRHPLLELSRRVPEAIVHTLSSTLSQRREWEGIAFNFLLRLLQVHPLVSNPFLELSPPRLREWINFLIEEKALRKFEEPDFREPARSTTMVALQDSHPLVKSLLDVQISNQFLEPKHQAILRTILTIDHFLCWLRTKSPEEDWLPLMTLKTWLRDALGDQLAKWAIGDCERDGVFVVSRYRNKGGPEATVAGLRLNRAQALVRQTLRQRNAFVELLVTLLRNRPALPHHLLEQRLSECQVFGETVSERLGWISLMTDARVLAIERDPGGADDSQSFLCRLNVREKFVGVLLGHVMDPHRREVPEELEDDQKPEALPSLDEVSPPSPSENADVEATEPRLES